MTEAPRISIPRIRNPKTQAHYRRQVLWQIYAPLFAAAATAIALMVLISMPLGAPVRRPWADVSLIFLIIPTALGGLMFLAVFAGIIYGLRYALRELPFVFNAAQGFAARIASSAKTGTDKVADRFIDVRAVAASARQVGEALLAIVRPRRNR